MVPLNAGACVPTPSAFSMPVTPSGRSLVLSVMDTPLVSSRLSLAWASALSGLTLAPLEPPPPLQPVAVNESAARTAPARRRRRGTGSAFHMHAGRDRPGAGGDGLAGRRTRAVAPTGRRWQVD